MVEPETEDRRSMLCKEILRLFCMRRRGRSQMSSTLKCWLQLRPSLPSKLSSTVEATVTSEESEPRARPPAPWAQRLSTAAHVASIGSAGDVAGVPGTTGAKCGVLPAPGPGDALCRSSSVSPQLGSMHTLGRQQLASPSSRRCSSSVGPACFGRTGGLSLGTRSTCCTDCLRRRAFSSSSEVTLAWSCCETSRCSQESRP
mmetsp:Transcript_10592/g.31105  ORF Transcript_10592/g.31105 Transcript_10592/m.31105 type:complete len:201 (+) Transcript_10592:1294-1896(+)